MDNESSARFELAPEPENPASQVASHLDTQHIRERPESAPSQLESARTPHDLTPSDLNQIARRDLHWLLLPVEHVLVYSACDLVQARPFGRFNGRMGGGAACNFAFFLVCGWLLQSASSVKVRRKKFATAS